MARFTHRHLTCLIIQALLYGSATATLAQEAGFLVINEVMSSNSSTHADPQGQYDDWVEIYNDTNQIIDAVGLYLTDNLDRPTKWQIPVNRPDLTLIDPNGYLVIWVDGDQEDSGLHASFQLAADGEELGLCAADGVTFIDQLILPALSSDLSYGRDPNVPDQWQFFVEPTPGAMNGEFYAGLVANMAISHEHGFYSEPFLVTLTCDTPQTTIYYSLNGQMPGQEFQGRTVQVSGTMYKEPLLVSETTCLRVVALRDGWKTSRISTQTYIFLGDVVEQSPHGQRPGTEWPAPGAGGGGSQVIDYGMDPTVTQDSTYKDLMESALLSIPTISLVTNPVNLFSSKTGIYVHALQDGRQWKGPLPWN